MKENTIESTEGGKEQNETISSNRQTDNIINFESLPQDFQDLLNSFKNNEKETIYLTILASVSSIIPSIYCKYDNNKVYSNLYLYITGRAGSGKGNAVWGRKLISFFEDYQNSGFTNEESLLSELMSCITNVSLNNSNYKILTPGNITSAGFMELLEKQQGNALLFETEGDTIANIHKTEHGNYSDIMRKAFHHEAITSYRKTNSQRIDIEYPRISIVISSTENQLKTLINNAENGLFSRFMFTETVPVEEFHNIFNNVGNNREQIFKEKAKKFSSYHTLLRNVNSLEFTFTDKQKHEFLIYFNDCKSIMTHLGHEDLDATVNRMGVIFVRICIVLDFIRNCGSTSLSDFLVCSDADFTLAKDTTQYLLLSAKSIFEKLSKHDNSISKLCKKKQYIYRELPNEFTTSEAKHLANDNDISERTLERFLNSEIFEKLGHGRYCKKQL